MLSTSEFADRSFGSAKPTGKVLVTGATGYVGQNLIARTTPEIRRALVKTSRRIDEADVQADLADINSASSLFDSVSPDVVVHLAGLRKSDAERDAQIAYRCISVATENVSKLCEKWGAHLIFISTDHVFDGKGACYSEENVANLIPSTVLGRAKLAAETAVRTSGCKYTIIRLAAIADDPRLWSFLIEHLRAGDPITVYSNRFFSPVLTDDVVGMLDCAIVDGPTMRVLHCAGEQRVSRATFFREIAPKHFRELLHDAEAPDSSFHPKDLSMGTDITRRQLGVKFTSGQGLFDRVRRQVSTAIRADINT